MIRTCECGHAFPVCACSEGLRGDALLARSRWLSSLSGWPARIAEPANPPVATVASLLDRMKSCPHWSASSTCGCAGVSTCALGRGKAGLVNVNDCFECPELPP